MQEACRSNAEDDEAMRAIDLLYDTALISSGFTVSDLILVDLLKMVPVLFEIYRFGPKLE